MQSRKFVFPLTSAFSTLCSKSNLPHVDSNRTQRAVRAMALFNSRTGRRRATGVGRHAPPHHATVSRAWTESVSKRNGNCHRRSPVRVVQLSGDRDYFYSELP